MEFTHIFFSNEPLLLNSSPLLCCAVMSSFLFIRWRKEREGMMVEEMMVRLSPCGVRLVRYISCRDKPRLCRLVSGLGAWSHPFLVVCMRKEELSREVDAIPSPSCLF